eukprot:TRINITY_DN19401_c0_g1_i1.p1 TRINITY_DN19401_c0_g1~~TRINITY_DN19401_c0_g1_i1.p1  ORF type:complete len:259 (+),score=58.12 TRINITY_DN19401_c0_g1_i1:71-847(+)
MSKPESWVPSTRGKPSVGILVNFKVRARGEPPHMVAAYRGLHLQNSESGNYMQMKKMSPNGHVPYIKLPNGELLAETVEICKFLAELPCDGLPVLCDDAQRDVFRKANTAPIIWDSDAGPGGTDRDNLGWLFNFIPWSEPSPGSSMFCRAGETAQSLFPGFKSKIMPDLQDFEVRLAASGGPFFSKGDTPGIGDFCVFSYMDMIKEMLPEILEDMGQHMKKHFETCAALPGIAEYMASRPQVGSGKLGNPGSLMCDGR